jgi:hypothetical protein
MSKILIFQTYIESSNRTHIQSRRKFWPCRCSCTYHVQIRHYLSLKKLSPLLCTDSSDSVRTCSDIQVRFLRSVNISGFMLVWWRSFNTKNFQIWISCLRKYLKKLSTAARMWNWSDWFDLQRKVFRSSICLFSVAFSKLYNRILCLSRSLLARTAICGIELSV